jgi:hypothetical protein
MLGFRTAFGVALAALVLSAAFGCGGSVAHGGPGGEAGSAEGGRATGRAGSATGGSLGRAGGGASNGATAQGGGELTDPDPVETGCPEEDLPPPDLECDPWTPGVCGPGAGCYPFVDHPEGNGCDQQRYGTLCLPAGQGVQGHSCGDDAGDCAEGFVCVVGQRAGKRCAALCQLGRANQCSGGLLCGDLDVAGFGVCG